MKQVTTDANGVVTNVESLDAIVTKLDPATDGLFSKTQDVQGNGSPLGE